MSTSRYKLNEATNAEVTYNCKFAGCLRETFDYSKKGFRKHLRDNAGHDVENFLENTAPSKKRRNIISHPVEYTVVEPVEPEQLSIIEEQISQTER